MVSLAQQLFWLFILAIPVACISWTVTHEEVFREPREYCVKKSKEGKSIWTRKFFYLFTCEYCFSHYVVVLILVLTNYHLLFDDWRGYFISGFSLVWIANVYMSLYRHVRVEIKKDNTEAELEAVELSEKQKDGNDTSAR